MYEENNTLKTAYQCSRDLLLWRQKFMNTSVNSGYYFSRICYIYVTIVNMTESQLESQLECEKNMNIVIVF